MLFVILRVLQHNELGVFHSYRRLGKERAKQRAINFDGDVVDRVFPAAKDSDKVLMKLRYQTDDGIGEKEQWVKRQEKNWRLEGNCPKDVCYDFVDPGCLFAMVVDSGKSPAIGSWAIFAADDPVTTAIFADGESSRLAGASMVALHGDEGERTLAMLCKSKPELFSYVASSARPPNSNKGTSIVEKTTKGVRLPPSPKRLPKILASVHAGLKAAVADIVDNSISHESTEVHIVFGRPDNGNGRWMSILDNGCGMNEDALAEAMRIGSETEYDSDNLGKFGYGLKGASWSQTPVFTVVSKTATGKAHDLTWDMDDIADWESKRGMLPAWAKDAANVGQHGTAIVWTKMRPPRGGAPVARGVDPYTTEVQDLQRHLGLIFHRFLEGAVANHKRVKITINGVPVVPHNPFGHKLTKSYDRKTVRVPTAKEDAKVFIQAFLLPAEWEIVDMHGANAEAARSDLDDLGLWGRRNESQGIYTYRNNRLISYGKWGDIWTTCDEKTKLARVSVDFQRGLDDQFHVDISKEKVALPRSLSAEIQKIAEVARNESRKKFKRIGRLRPTTAGDNGTIRVGTPAISPYSSGPKQVPSPPQPTPSVGTGTPVLHSTPPITVRVVKSDKFAWKIVEDLAGGKEVQIDEAQTDLRAVAEAIKHDPATMATLVAFLGRLDAHVVQTKIVGQRTTA